MIARLLPLLSLLATVSTATASTPSDTAKAQDELLRNVERFGAPGHPGGVCAFGPDAFVVVTGTNQAPVAAAAGFGKGRVLALGHGWYLGRTAAETADTDDFYRNALRWLSGGKRSPRVATPGHDKRAQLFEDLGAKAEKTHALEDFDIVVLDGGAALGARRRVAIERFVHEGGALLIAATGWGWAQLNPEKTLAHDLPGNRLLRPMGLAFTGEVVGLTAAPDALLATPRPHPLAHAGHAFDALRSGRANGDESEIALRRLRAALPALSDHEPLLALPLRRHMERATELGGLLGFLEPYEARTWRPLGVRFGRWSLVGPFPHAKGARDIRPTAPPEKVLELCALDGPGPDLKDSFRARKQKAVWEPFDGRGDGFELDVGPIRFDRWYGGGKRSVAYLHRVVEVDAHTELDCRVGNDDGIRFWLNGELVIDRNSSQGMEIEEQSLTLTLLPGRNHILVKVSNEDGAWGLRLRADTAFDRGAVDRAIDCGIGWLLDTQLLDGSWEGWPEYGPGFTAFAAYTLSKTGLPPNHPALKRALAYIDANPAAHTYSLSSVILARCALATEEALATLETDVADLIEMQEHNGLYSYPRHPGHGGGAPDTSCTLMATLAFRAAEEQGVEVPLEVWRGLVDGTLLCWTGSTTRKKDLEAAGAGFSYRVNEKATGSMTTAGLSVLQIARERLGRKLKKQTAREVDTALDAGLTWLESNWRWDQNPNHTGFHYFWLYGIERLGALLDRSILGKVDWYRSGAEFLVQTQRKDGQWAGAGGHSNERSDTCLALLFLNRATAPKSGKSKAPHDLRLAEAPDLQISIRARGANPLSVWVTGWGDEVRKKHAWPAASLPAPFVERMRWVARRAGGTEEHVLAEIEGDPQRVGSQRFEAKLTFPEPGSWEVQAIADAVSPAASPGAAGTPLRLESGVLVISAPGPADGRAAEYVHDAARNLLRDGGARISASSHHGSQAAALAVDGKYGTRWHSAAADSAPWWRIVLSRAALADRLYLSHAWPRAKDRDSPRPARVRITINDDETHELDVDLEPWNKTTLRLSEPTKVKSLRIDVLDSRSRTVGSHAVGFSEIELILERS